MSRPGSALGRWRQELLDLVERVRPATVSVVAHLVSGEELRGSGWAFDQHHVVTNNHVVAVGEVGCEFAVRLGETVELPAELVASDSLYDVAVLRVAATLDAHLELRRQPARPGEPCMALGCPDGLLDTVTVGVVSGLDRSFGDDDGDVALPWVLQTDAALNPGNSGGPLVDVEGRLIGMTIGGQPERENLGFAIPAVVLRWVVPVLAEGRRPVPPSLGVKVDERWLPDGTARRRRHLVVTDVADPAGALQPDDRLLTVDSVPVASLSDLLLVLTPELCGREVPVEVERAGTRTVVGVPIPDAC